jgi:DNA-binding PadR family transcriptional regulator
MDAEALKGHLDLILLATVEPGACHGYAIIERLRERSHGTFDLAEGTVYPALHRLERAGLLRSSWSAESGRKRRLYELTPKGRGALREQRSEWRQFVKGIDSVLEGAT